MASHLKEVVGPKMGSSLGLFIAAKEPCIGIASEPPVKGRQTQRVRPQQLAALPALPSSFAIAVLLCPGDETLEVTMFAKARRIDSDRFYFFYTDGTDLRLALKAWTEAAYDVLYSFEIKDWKGLNKKFGAFWNHWIHDDHCLVPGCRMR